MPGSPEWVRRNRFVAWTSLFCVLIGFATLAMSLTAAGSGHHGWAVTAGIICACAFLGGMALYGSTAHHDRVTHHAVPNILWDTGAPPTTRDHSGHPRDLRSRMHMRRAH